MNHVTQPLGSAGISIFSPETSKLCYIKKYRYRLHFDVQFTSLLNFFESLKIVLINMVATLMMSAKMSTLGLLKEKIFWNKGYDDIIYVQGVINKILSCDLYNIVDVVMRPKFGNSSIYMTEITIISIL